MALLVAEDDDIDTQMLRCRVLCNGSSSLQRIDAAERPIEPPCMVLTFKMRSRESLATARTALAQYVGDAIDLGIEPGLTHAAREPFSCSDVRVRQGGTMHTCLVGAEG